MSERLGRGAAAPPGLWADAARAWPVASGDRRGLGDRRGQVDWMKQMSPEN